MLRDSLEKKETRVIPSQWPVSEETKVTPASLGHLVFLVWTAVLVVTDNLDSQDQKELL